MQITDKIPNKFMSGRLQEAFEFYWKSMKSINENIPEETIYKFFINALETTERLGYIKL